MTGGERHRALDGLTISSVQDFAVAVDQLPIDNHWACLIGVGHVQARGLALRDADHAERDAIDNRRWWLFLGVYLPRPAKYTQSHQCGEPDEHRRDC